MSQYVKIKRGLNIKLVGEAQKVYGDSSLSETFAIKPDDFRVLAPKLLVQPGTEVLAGTPLFYDKANEVIKFCSPVSGEVIEVVRGEKRRILEIRILADKEISYRQFEVADPNKLSRDQVKQILLDSGAWPMIRQRPYGIIANPERTPKSIFISAFDTSPLAPDMNFIMRDVGEEFQVGLDALRRLTDGRVHLNIHDNATPAPVFAQAREIQINKISGPHPSGNVGVQIHHIDPVNKGEVVWCVQPQDVLIIGRLFASGKFDARKTVAVTGSQISRPAYYKTVIGAAVKNMVEHAGWANDACRLISGNVLTGTRISKEGYLNFYDSQLTAIPEGNLPEFMGWLTPGFQKLSMSRAFFSWMHSPNKRYDINTNLHGEERPFVVSGEYEKVFPMDIYPVQLLKSILIEDIEMMENLGIYEVVEEDFALCEFVCTSKIESQDIIRRGLNIMRKEFGN